MTGAHGLQAIPYFAPLQLVDQLGHRDGVCRTDQVSIGDGVTVGVDFFHIRLDFLR